MEMAVRSPLENTIHWVNAAFLSQGRNTEAAIHPIGKEDEAPCFGITVGNQWVIGADGTLTVFDTPETARRFLKLLGFHRANWRSNGRSPTAPRNRGQQLYQLRGHRLQTGGQLSCR